MIMPFGPVYDHGRQTTPETGFLGGRVLKTRYLLAGLSMVSALAFESGHHVVVELFDRLIPRPVRPYVQQFAAVLTIVFGAVFLYQLYRMTSRAFADDRLAVAAIAVPLKWVYIIGPIGIVQFNLTALAELGRAQWKAGADAEATPSH